MTSQLYLDLPLPALSLIAVLDFYSTKEQGFYYLSSKWIKNIFISFSYNCIHPISIKKSHHYNLYISFSMAYKPSYSVLGEILQDHILKNWLIFPPQTLF